MGDVNVQHFATSAYNNFSVYIAITLSRSGLKIQQNVSRNQPRCATWVSNFTCLINFHLYELILRWLNILKTHFVVDGVEFTIFLFADDQSLKSEDKSQEAVYKLSQTIRSKKTTVREFAGVQPIKEKITAAGKISD
jgi:hypothetical protein